MCVHCECNHHSVAHINALFTDFVELQSILGGKQNGQIIINQILNVCFSLQM